MYRHECHKYETREKVLSNGKSTENSIMQQTGVATAENISISDFHMIPLANTHQNSSDVKNLTSFSGLYVPIFDQ